MECQRKRCARLLDEPARHAGHADILRQLADGDTRRRRYKDFKDCLPAGSGCRTGLQNGATNSPMRRRGTEKSSLVAVLSNETVDRA